jgi:hypothetical protein
LTIYLVDVILNIRKDWYETMSYFREEFAKDLTNKQPELMTDDEIEQYYTELFINDTNNEDELYLGYN